MISFDSQNYACALLEAQAWSLNSNSKENEKTINQKNEDRRRIKPGSAKAVTHEADALTVTL